MSLRERFKLGLQDWVMGIMDPLREETIGAAQGDVLEVGFGTARNLEHYGSKVSSLTGVDPMPTEGVAVVEERIARASFPVERSTLRADGDLPFDAGRFDCVVATWTLCSIPDPVAALVEMRRVLAPHGQLLFVEHGRSEAPGTARWQDRLNPYWRSLSDGCNMNRQPDRLVEQGGFALESLERFRGKGPSVLACMYRGVARPA